MLQASVHLHNTLPAWHVQMQDGLTPLFAARQAGGAFLPALLAQAGGDEEQTRQVSNGGQGRKRVCSLHFTYLLQAPFSLRSKQELVPCAACRAMMARAVRRVAHEAHADGGAGGGTAYARARWRLRRLTDHLTEARAG